MIEHNAEYTLSVIGLSSKHLILDNWPSSILSNLFKVSPSYLMCIEDESSSALNNIEYTNIPLISEYNENLETSMQKSFVWWNG